MMNNKNTSCPLNSCNNNIITRGMYAPDNINNY